MNMVEKLLSVVFGKDKGFGGHRVVGNTLGIDCRGCGNVPEPRSPACIRCMVSKLSECGNVDRIMMSTSRDIEVSGAASEILCDMASVERSMSSVSKSERMYRCKNCEFSCREMFDTAWAGFPDPFFENARSRLMMFRPQDMECENCIQKTYRALDQAELSFSGIKKKASAEAVRGGR